MVASFSFYMLPTQVGVRYFYPGIMFLALAVIRNRRLIAIYLIMMFLFLQLLLHRKQLSTA